LRSALNARSAEASLYRKQYESLCRKLDSLEEQQRQASAAARAKVPPSPYSLFLLPDQAGVQRKYMLKALLLHQLADISCCLCNAVVKAAGEQHHCQEQLQQS